MRRTVPLLVLATVAVAATALLRGGDHYVVRAAFVDASGLRTGFSVKIGGVSVGRVAGLQLGRGDTAIAKLEIDKSATPVGRDASATIRPSNLLGEKYVDLHPGDASRPAASGTLVPATRTATPTELDDLLDVLDTPTRSALGVFISEQGRALVGRGDQLASMLVALPPALDEAQALVAGLARDNRALGRLVEESDRIFGSVGRERSSLGHFVESASGALETLASRRRSLGQTVRQAPAAMAQLRRSLVKLDRAAGPLGPAARGLRATAPPLTETLRALPPFVDAARPTLRTARAVAPSLDRLGRRAAPVVNRLRPLASELRDFGGVFDPFSSVLEAAAPDLLGVVEGWARSIQDRDAAGHVFRAGLTVGSELVGRLQQGYIEGLSPMKNRRRPAHTPNAAPAPDARPHPQLPLQIPKLKIPRPELALPRPQLPPVGVPPLRRPDPDHSPVGRLLDYLLRP